MQSLIKMITSAWRTDCMSVGLSKIFSASKNIGNHRFWFRQGLRWLYVLILRYEVVKKSILKKSQLLGVFSTVPYLPVGNAVFKLLICLLWVLRNRILLPHLPNPWLWGTAHWKWVSMAILCKSPIMLCKKPAVMHVLHPSQSWTLSNTFLWRSMPPTWRAWCSTWSQ